MKLYDKLFNDKPIFSAQFVHLQQSVESREKKSMIRSGKLIKKRKFDNHMVFITLLFYMEWTVSEQLN